jgi:capsular polysaccharide export protein
MIIPANRQIARIPHIAELLADHPRAVAGWGRKPSGQRAQRWARWLRRPFVLLEDGFIRSLGRDDPPLSLIVDDVGVFYDATAPSAMEAAIAAGVNTAQAARARALVQQWRGGAVSKYNHAAEYAGLLPESYVLVVDQTLGDLSVALGGANAEAFAAMLAAALDEYPDEPVVVKIHPDVFVRAKRGWLPEKLLSHPRIRLIGESCHAARLLRQARAVYAVTSLMGFEALLWDKPVRCFGMPFYAGWGLTQDVLPAPQRRSVASREALVHAALVTLPRYANPAGGALWQAEDAIAHVAAGRARQWGEAG